MQVDLAARDELSAGLDGVPHVQGLTVRYVDELVLQGAISCNMCALSTLFSTKFIIHMSVYKNLLITFILGAAPECRAILTYR